jgi:drug/metabolite transporter (DMT)-like permease
MLTSKKTITSFKIIAIILWSSCFVGIRAALIEYSPIEIAVLRFVISSMALFLLITFQRINLPHKKDYILFTMLGLVQFINHIALNYGTRTITAGETTLIISSSQLFQVLLAYLFLNEIISFRFLIGLFFCFFGVSIIALQNSIGLSFNWGVFFVLLAAITNAIFFILQKPLLKKYKPMEVISYSTWLSTIMFLPFGEGVIDVMAIAGRNATIAVIYIGVATVIANIFWSKILSKVEASKAAVFLYTVPVMTIIIGFLWLRELPSLISCIGGVIILGGVALSNSNVSGPKYTH